jgi:hypothetical protein
MDVPDSPKETLEPEGSLGDILKWVKKAGKSPMLATPYRGLGLGEAAHVG